MKKKILVHGSTFSGIGAPEVAAEMLGWENAFHCEINQFGRQILDYYFPNAESYEDITKTDFGKWGGRIDVLTGGFPCQPFSYAGKRRGSEDDRYLWPYMLKCIHEVRPTWFIGENVAGITTMVFPGEDVEMGNSDSLFDQGDLFRTDERYVIEEICQSLEREGYSVQPMLIPACAVGAPHRRDRVFFIAHRNDSKGTLHGGQLGGEYDQQRRERNFRHFGAGDTERICRKERLEMRSASDTCGVRLQQTSNRIPIQTERGECEQNFVKNEKRRNAARSTSNSECDRGREVHQPLQSQLTDGTEPFGNGGESDVADTDGAGLQESKFTGRGENTAQAGAGMDCGTERFDTDNGAEVSGGGNDAYAFSDGLERQNESGSREGGERMHIWRDIAGYDWQNLLPENRWRTFPTVSPVYRGNDGLPFPVDHLTIPFSQWKKESLKAYGNAIVVQVMYEIFKAIDDIENQCSQ